MFQPLLYQVATAALNPANIASPIRRILRGVDNVEVLLGEVESIDVRGQDAQAERRRGPLRLPDRRHRRDPQLFRPRRMGGERAGLEVDRGRHSISAGGSCWPTRPPSARPTRGVDASGRPSSSSARARPGSSWPAPWPRSPATTWSTSSTNSTRPGRGSSCSRPALGSSRPTPKTCRRRPRSSSRHLGVDVRVGTKVTGIDGEGVTTESGHIAARTVLWGAGVRARRWRGRWACRSTARAGSRSSPT